MKKSYKKPEALVIDIEVSQLVCLSNINSNVGLTPGGGGNGDARAPEMRRGSDWDEYLNN